MTDACPLVALDRRLAALTGAAAGAAVVPLGDSGTDVQAAVPARAVVLGEGGGGAGWAAALAGAGVETTLLLADSADLARLADLLARAARRDPALVPFALSLDPVPGAGLLVVPDAQDAAQHPALNGALPAALDALPPDGVVIGAGDLDLLHRLDARLPASRRLIGLHLPPPAAKGRLVEVMPARPDAPWQAGVLAMAQALSQRLGRRPVILPPGMASPARALLGHLTACADALLMSGATPWDLDDAMQSGGWAQGLFLLEDQAGIDQMVTLRAAHAAATGQAVVPIAPRMLAEGRLGQQGGVGWYRYPGGGGPVIDPLMEDMCTEEAHFARWPRAVPGPGVIRARLILAVIAGAAGLADRLPLPVLDAIARQALGFPAALGGPLALAARLGGALEAPLAASMLGGRAGARRVLAALPQAANGSSG